MDVLTSDAKTCEQLTVSGHEHRRTWRAPRAAALVSAPALSTHFTQVLFFFGLQFFQVQPEHK